MNMQRSIPSSVESILWILLPRCQAKHLLGDLFRIGGLWQHTQVVEVEDQMKALKLRSHAKQLNALKTQIKTRKVILNQEADAALFAFSVGGRQHSVPTLVNNLCALVKAASQHDTEPDFFNACIIDPTLLVGRKIRHIWSTDNGDEAFMGEILGVKTAHGTSEFEILYDEHEERIFVEFDEVLTDLKCVDLQIM